MSREHGRIRRSIDAIKVINPVGAEQALINVSTALEAAGASFDDVAKTTIYVVGWRPEMMEALVDGLRRVAVRLGVDPLRPTTLVGVEALAAPDLLVEFDVTAVVA